MGGNLNWDIWHIHIAKRYFVDFCKGGNLFHGTKNPTYFLTSC